MVVNTLVTSFIYDGILLVGKKVWDYFKKRRTYLIVITNKEHIVKDVESALKKKCFFKIVNEQFSLESSNLKNLVKLVVDKVNETPLKSNIFLVCTLNILSFLLGCALHHSARRIHFLQFDLKEKVYRIYRLTGY